MAEFKARALNMIGRKFALTCVVFVCVFVAFMAGRLSEAGFTTVTLGTVGAYLAANFFEGYQGKEKNGVDNLNQ